MNTFLSTLTLTAALFAGSAEAHGKMTAPKSTRNSTSCTNAFSSTIDGPSVLTAPAGMSFKLYAEAQTKYKSLLGLVYATQALENGASQEYGFSHANGTAQPLPEVVEWTELSSSRQRPCEVWCDDVLAFSDENCAINYPEAPARLPYDMAKCTDAKMLKSVWTALHLPVWQVYHYCAPLLGPTSNSSSSGSASEPSASSSGSDATSVVTFPPSSANSASVAGEATMSPR